MPHTESAKKRLRQNEKRRQANKARATELKTIRKQLLRALHDGKKDDAQTLYREFTSRVDQAASLNVIHRNAAARAKARLAVRLAAGPTTTTKPAV